jgi:hypothetical protein
MAENHAGITEAGTEFRVCTERSEKADFAVSDNIVV